MNSQLVATFLEQYARLKGSCDDDPVKLYHLAYEDDYIFQLCKSIYQKSNELKSHELSYSEALSSPTSPEFIKSWREWEYKFEKIIFDVLFLASRDGEPVDISFDLLDEFGVSRWQMADLIGMRVSVGLNELVILSHLLSDAERHKFKSLIYGPSDNEEDSIPGHEAWNILTERVGVNPSMNMRRRVLVPFVLVPRKVSDRISLQHRANLIRILEDAQRAFIFGANNAAVALLRSVMESILRDYYGAEGQRIDELIFSALDRLPHNVNAKKLNDLRKLANLILHNADRKIDPWAGKGEREIEENIVSMFELIRSLIEGVN